MEPATARGPTEKSFSYVVQTPSGEGFDTVTVKVHTRWVFQDAEDTGEGQGCLSETVAGCPDMAVPGEQSSEQKPWAVGDTDKDELESVLRSRIQELELSERRLLQKLDQLGARMVRERSASLRTWETLQALQTELAGRVREQESTARRLRERLRRKDELLGQQAVALERCRRTQRRQLGLVRQQERVLRAQVKRLERDVRRLCRAAGRLLAQLDAAAPASVTRGSPQALVPAHATTGAAEEAAALAAELRALQARAEQEREKAARRLREQRTTECRLRAQLEELRCCVFGLQLSEIGLQGRVEDLAQQNQSLREQLGAQAAPVWGGGLVPLAEPGLDEHSFLLVCGGPPGSLLPVDLAWISENLPGNPAQQPSVLVQPVTWPLGESPGDPAALLLLLQPPPGELHTEEGLGTRHPCAAEVSRHPGWARPQTGSHDLHLCQESSLTSERVFPRDAWAWGGATGTRTEAEEAQRRAAERMDGAPGSEFQLGQGRQEAMTLGSGLGVLEGVQGKTQPWPGCPVPLLQGEASAPLQGREGEGSGGWGVQGEEKATSLASHAGTGERGPRGQERAARCRGECGLGQLLRSASMPLLCKNHRWEEGQEPGVPCQEGCVPKEVDPEDWEGLGASSGGKRGSLRWPRSVTSANRHGPWADGQGHPRFTLELEELEQELEACLRQLSLLQPEQVASPAGGGSGSLAARPDLPQVFGNKHLEVCVNEAKPQEGQALGLAPVSVWEEASSHPPEGPSGFGGHWQSLPWRALKKLRCELHQLLPRLKSVRSLAFHCNTKLQGDQGKLCMLDEQRASNATGLASPVQPHSMPQGDATRLQEELAQCLQVISDLEDCNSRSYCKILELEEENAKLKEHLGAAERVVLQHQGLETLLLGLRASCKELTQRVDGMIQHLPRRLHVLEADVAARAGPGAVERLVGEGEPFQEATEIVERKMQAVDKEVQAAPPSGQPMAGPHGPPREDTADPAVGPVGPCSAVENSGSGVGSMAVAASSGLQGSPIGAGDQRAHQEKRLPSPGLQLQVSGAQAPQEDPGLRIRRLHHQVLTLQCQLRDQASAGRELQLAWDAAVRHQEELRGQLEKLQRRQHEADLAVPPLKAKLASLVRKCRERNHLITHLLQELHRRGPEDHALSQLAQSMADDTALAEYTVKFLAQDTLDAPELLPPTVGPVSDPAVTLGVAAVEPAFPAPFLQARGGLPGPTLPTTGLPLSSELQSPARILAFHQELRRSLSSHVQGSAALLEV